MKKNVLNWFEIHVADRVHIRPRLHSTTHSPFVTVQYSPYQDLVLRALEIGIQVLEAVRNNPEPSAQKV
ncbi:MAG: hypothetical protein JJU00_00210 [Opitutales bacterium]|nr:hypothetical protein [Opitutales bacterium]